MIIPARTSVGKCTYRYILENAIDAASITAGIQSLFRLKKSTAAAENAQAVCPDGNEKSEGGFISRTAAGFCVNGRGRVIIGFKINRYATAPAASEMPIRIPVFLVRGITIRISVSKIQIKPPSPRCVMTGITASSTGFFSVF